MAGTNRSRVLMGGLAAGLVINVGEFLLNVPIAGPAFDAAMLEAGIPLPTGNVILMYVAMAFAWGLAVVWTYAAIRPRYGPGPMTAVRAGLVLWVVGYLFPALSFAAMGLFPPSLLLMTVVWGMVEIPLAALAGAWVYRESEAPATVPASAGMI